MTDQQPDEWMDTQSLAEWTHLPPPTLVQWRYKGTGPRFVRFGRHVRYRRSDVEAWIAEQYREAS